MTVDVIMNNIEKAVEGIDLDKALDDRDQAVFDQEWLRVFHQVEELKKERMEEYNKAKLECDKYRQEAYIRIYNACENSDISACVSDDIGLIYDAEFLQYSDVWLDALISSYQNIVFPCGGIL